MVPNSKCVLLNLYLCAIESSFLRPPAIQDYICMSLWGGGLKWKGHYCMFSVLSSVAFNIMVSWSKLFNQGFEDYR